MITTACSRECIYSWFFFFSIVFSHPSLPTHPNWTVRIFNARGDHLYLGGLHISPEGVTSFRTVDEELHSKFKGKTLNGAFARKRRLIL